ncbi:Eukaryotic translation initiation factor 4E [Spraguea lophii 42_110]|uniref:Eukaryotic translation initiation factor 4E n=1 Tax=Spraguea lophii (strain 42_110) TaxID=1358809 RepID=S7W5N5_SPRLO|nr:Eukaryotic translation initiation factor 4E [Spraguea lophii 42_110]
MKFYTPFQVQTIHRLGPRNYNIDFKQSLTPMCILNNYAELSYFLRYLKPLEEIPTISDITVFKVGILPLWEDESNIAGCKWIIKLKREVCMRLFEKFLIRMCYSNFNTFDINGIALSIRSQHVIFSVWSKYTPENDQHKNIVKEIKETLGIEFFVSVEYKDNDESLKDNSSFRNTRTMKVMK